MENYLATDKLIDVNATLFSLMILTKDLCQVFLKFVYYCV